MIGEAFKEAFVEADGFRIRYLDGGVGPVLVCLHGGGGLRLAAAHDILAKDHRVIAFEMPGFGASPENRRSTSTEDLARSMNAAVAALRVERYSLMGTSFGSKVALWMAIHEPEAVDAIVLISPAAIREQQGPVPTHIAPEEAAKLLYAHPERQPKAPPPAARACRQARRADQSPARPAARRTLRGPARHAAASGARLVRHRRPGDAAGGRASFPRDPAQLPYHHGL